MIEILINDIEQAMLSCQGIYRGTLTRTGLHVLKQTIKSQTQRYPTVV